MKFFSIGKSAKSKATLVPYVKFRKQILIRKLEQTVICMMHKLILWSELKIMHCTCTYVCI